MGLDFYLKRGVECEKAPGEPVYDVEAVNNGTFSGRIPLGTEHGHRIPPRTGGIDYETGRYSKHVTSGGNVGVCHGRLHSTGGTR